MNLSPFRNPLFFVAPAGMMVALFLYAACDNKTTAPDPSSPNDSSQTDGTPQSDDDSENDEPSPSTSSAGHDKFGTDDKDGDGIFNPDDNCPLNPNSDQLDADEDGLMDIVATVDRDNTGNDSLIWFRNTGE